jgi:hypothetical protein
MSGFLANRVQLHLWGKVAGKRCFRQVIVNNRIGNHETLPTPESEKSGISRSGSDQ